MNNLYNESDVLGILNRIEKLSPNSQRQWGQMNAEQMLSHLNAFLETALDLNSPRRLVIGRILGSFFKSRYVSAKRFSINSRTHKEYVFIDIRDFEKEKAKSIQLVNQFFDGGTSQCTSKPHSFFGKLTPEEWAIAQWKHFDHHLRQFGV
ncbi:DUF1569 domain-containing protein [Flavobacterium hercynium]|uniref:DUF1569 domain-containing protein n=1 Tax=Flavobacterium hercynium TaxID=387094 RepID=A0A226GYH1_9FLAO|nr:DUF1569 domain-containing protein [Flavobacterium hercynium]OXA86618.1 hypothetical protein B0A66_17615 [Flavobacterium hercynium]SMP25349.1 Protein of unknown function [Flavobacterium hercynium]